MISNHYNARTNMVLEEWRRGGKGMLQFGQLRLVYLYTPLISLVLSTCVNYRNVLLPNFVNKT